MAVEIITLKINNKFPQRNLAILVSFVSTTASLIAGVCAIKHYGFVNYGFCGKLVPLPKQVNVTDNRKDTSLL